MASPAKEISPTITVTDGKQAAYIHIPPGCDPLLLTEDALLGLVRASGVEVSDHVKRAIASLAQQLCDGQGQEGDGQAKTISKEVARAQQPIHGVDGRVEWLVDDTPKDPETENISYYDQCAFVMVHNGDTIGKVYPPTYGEDGRDVRGETTPALSGKEAKLIIDESIMRRPDGSLIAQSDGVLYRDGDNAQIRKRIEIKENVDFSTGNIDFDGDVYIKGGVKDCFVVKATGDIEVCGLIEAATIETDQDLIAKGGFAGRERGIATIGGCLRGKYLDNVHGYVEKDLCIDREVINCELRIDGGIDSPAGSIIGGRVVVTGAINIGTLGSSGDTPTELVIGSVPKLEPFVASLSEIFETVSESSNKLTDELDMITKLSRKGRMTPTDKERQTEIMFELSSIKSAMDRAGRTLDSINQEVEARRTVDVTVNSTLHSGTLLIYRDKSFKIKREMRGPVVIKLDSKKTPVYRQGNGEAHPVSDISDVHAVLNHSRAA